MVSDCKLTNFSKMRVSHAFHVLSKKSGNVMSWYVEKYPEKFPREYLTTAFFLEKVGGFLDITANYTKNMAFWAKDPKGKNEEKINYLNWFCNFYCSMKLHPKQKETVLKPTQKGVLITVNSIIGMQETLLKDHDYNYFLTKF